MPYFRVATRYIWGSEAKRNVSMPTEHIVRADSSADARGIAVRHKIAYPMGADDIYSQHVCDRSPSLKTLNQRRHGLGGSIWFEDKNGNLCCEDSDCCEGFNSFYGWFSEEGL